MFTINKITQSQKIQSQKKSSNQPHLLITHPFQLPHFFTLLILQFLPFLSLIFQHLINNILLIFVSLFYLFLMFLFQLCDHLFDILLSHSLMFLFKEKLSVLDLIFYFLGLEKITLIYIFFLLVA